MFTIQINDADVSAMFDRLQAALTDMSKPMNDVGRFLVKTTKERIGAGITPEGNAFAPRAQSTHEAYARKNFSYGLPLNRSGDMRKNSISHDYGSDFAEVGSNAIQSAVMQFGAAKGSLGANSPWGNIPARPFIGLSDSDQTGIIDILEEWLERSTRTAT